MGAALSYYLAVGLLANDGILPPGTRIRIVAFGSPRVGDQSFSSFWKKLVDDYRSSHGQDSLQEYSVRAYNDGESDGVMVRQRRCNSPSFAGVPMLPLMKTGYVHHTTNPLFLRNDQLFKIPDSEKEYGSFDIPPTEGAPPPLHPKGGHNYYNGREFERLARRVDSIGRLMRDEDDLWVESYVEEVTRVERLSHSNDE